MHRGGTYSVDPAWLPFEPLFDATASCLLVGGMVSRLRFCHQPLLKALPVALAACFIALPCRSQSAAPNAKRAESVDRAFVVGTSASFRVLYPATAIETRKYNDGAWTVNAFVGGQANFVTIGLGFRYSGTNEDFSTTDPYGEYFNKGYQHASMIAVGPEVQFRVYQFSKRFELFGLVSLGFGKTQYEAARQSGNGFTFQFSNTEEHFNATLIGWRSGFGLRAWPFSRLGVQLILGAAGDHNVGPKKSATGFSPEDPMQYPLVPAYFVSPIAELGLLLRFR